MKEQKTFPTSILITDDHSVIRKTLREWLCEEYPDLIIQEASSGEDALEILSSQDPPELVVMDFHLPGITGIDATREIKRLHPHIPVLILTIQEDQVYIDQALKAGADSYVIKRQMYNELIPSIQKLFNDRDEQN